MEIDPGMSALVGLVVWLLGLIYKWWGRRRGWEPDSPRMVAVVLVLSIGLGLLQCLMQGALHGLPAPPPDLPALVFLWLPALLGWLAATVGAVFSVSQGIYTFMRRVVFGHA